MIQNYIRLAWRNLRRNKVSSIISIFGLAIGLTTCIIIMLVVQNEVSYDKFHKNLADTYLVMKNQKHADGISTGRSTSGPLAFSLKNDMPETKYVSRMVWFDQLLTGVNDKKTYEVSMYVDPDFFNIMGFHALRGNPAAVLREAQYAVITERTAKKFFGNDNPIGKMIQIDTNQAFKVGAVIENVPYNSSFQFDIALPFSAFAEGKSWLTKWDDNRIQTWVQLKPSANIAVLNNKITKLLQQRSNDASVSLFVYPFSRLRLYGDFFNGRPNGGRISMVKTMSLLGLFILLVACINFMNIATSHAERRAREVGVRKVLGSSRKLIILQFIGESLLLTFFALLLGVAATYVTIPLFNKLTNNNIQFNYLDWGTWALLGGIGLFTGLIAGSYPAFFLSRFNPVKVLKGVVVTGSGRALLRKLLVTVQFVIAIFFIIGTIAIYVQIEHVRNRPLGYDQENLIDISVNTGLERKYSLFKNELSQFPNVKGVTAGSESILQFNNGVSSLEWPGKTPGQDIPVMTTFVQYDWIKTMGLQLSMGRDFDPSFGSDTASCLVNQETVARLGLKEPVIGTKLSGKKIIGVFQNFVFNNPSGVISPMVVYLDTGRLGHFFVRFRNNAHWRQTIAQIEKAVKKINPDYPFDFTFVKEGYQERFKEWASFGMLSSIFSCMAVIISCLGLFGLSAFIAEKRGKEMSIRKVFGATFWSVWIELSKDFLKPVFIALMIVIPSSVWLSRWYLSNITYHTNLDWRMYMIVILSTIMISVLTISYQGMRIVFEKATKRLKNE